MSRAMSLVWHGMAGADGKPNLAENPDKKPRIRPSTYWGGGGGVNPCAAR